MPNSGTQSAVVWSLVHSFLLWCLWREMKDISFEDYERTLEEIKSLFFCTPTFVYPLVISYYNFLVLFSPS
jgi:hypothetical protein